MILMRHKAMLTMTLLFAFLLSSCSSVNVMPAESWKLPAKQNAKSAMIVGRIGLEGNKPLATNAVTVQLWGKGYFHMGNVPRGEEEFLIDNSYFVIPNIEPGKYWFAGFYADGTYNRMPADEKDFINVKPGEIKFIGSFDYVAGNLKGLKTAFGIPGSFELKRAQNPTELEMMRWLLRASKGSGWESDIKRRINVLGGSKN
ncbi:MAG: hypothetical protein OEV15_10600 [Gallionella sp.]|nr:hypothetical protein [Gallionella sp.]